MIPASVYKRYREIGISTFPIYFKWDASNYKYKKLPAVPTHLPYRERFPTDEEIAQWHNRYPGLNIVTGKISKLLVLDVDDDTDYPFLTSSVVVKSAFSGGKHYYYRYEKETPSIDRLFDKVDLKADKGTIAAPPSSFNGKEYSFIEKPDFNALQPLPANIYNLTHQQKQKTTIESQGDIYDLQADSGNRNETATKVAGSIIAKLKPSQWHSFGWASLKEWNHTKCNPPLEEQELKTVFDSVMAAEMRKNNQDEPVKESDFNIYHGMETVEVFNQMKEQYGSGMSTTFQALDEYFTFIPQHIYLLAAPTHMGKTTVALNLAARMAVNKRVLLASLEMGTFIVPAIQRIMRRDYPPNLDVLTTTTMISATGLINIIHNMQNKPDILFLDHIHFFERKSGSVSLTAEIDRIIIEIQNMAKILDIPVLLVAHTRKLNQDRPPRIDDLKDSASLGQVPSVVMQIYRKEMETEEGKKQSYLNTFGQLYIQKNRIQGRTGMLEYMLDDERLSFNGFTTEDIHVKHKEEGQASDDPFLD